jgi:hypothetical protein
MSNSLRKILTLALLFAGSTNSQVLHNQLTPKLRDVEKRPAGMGLRIV